MQTLTIHLINPKAKKLIKDLASLKLISIEENHKYPEELKSYLDHEYQNHESNKSENYTRKDLNKELLKIKSKVVNV